MSSIDSYKSHVEPTTTVSKCNGNFIVTIKGWDEKPCNCHPETCTHFDEKIKVYWEQKEVFPITKK